MSGVKEIEPQKIQQKEDEILDSWEDTPVWSSKVAEVSTKGPSPFCSTCIVLKPMEQYDHN